MHSSGPVSLPSEGLSARCRLDLLTTRHSLAARTSAPRGCGRIRVDSETRDPAALPADRDSFHELWHAPDSAELTQRLVDAYVPAERPQDADVVAVSAPCNRSP